MVGKSKRLKLKKFHLKFIAQGGSRAICVDSSASQAHWLLVEHLVRTMSTNEPHEEVARLLFLSATLVVKQLLVRVLERSLHGEEPNTLSGSDSIAMLTCTPQYSQGASYLGGRTRYT